jgi:hypothetical protein
MSKPVCLRGSAGRAGMVHEIPHGRLPTSESLACLAQLSPNFLRHTYTQLTSVIHLAVPMGNQNSRPAARRKHANAGGLSEFKYFLALPAEIRIQIYDLLLLQPEMVFPHPSHHL